MKTKALKNNELQSKRDLEVLSNVEMEKINGGLRMITLRDSEGNVRVVLVP